MLGALAFLLHVDLPRGQGAGTCYVVGQQYSDRFPEIVMVELSNGRGTEVFQYRFEVIRDIEEGWNYYTAHLVNGRLAPLQKLSVVAVGSEKYLRIDGLAIDRDDLGDIPEI